MQAKIKQVIILISDISKASNEEKKYCYNGKGKTHNGNLTVVNSFATENSHVLYRKK